MGGGDPRGEEGWREGEVGGRGVDDVNKVTCASHANGCVGGGGASLPPPLGTLPPPVLFLSPGTPFAIAYSWHFKVRVRDAHRTATLARGLKRKHGDADAAAASSSSEPQPRHHLGDSGGGLQCQIVPHRGHLCVRRDVTTTSVCMCVTCEWCVRRQVCQCV
jgi:hypothetical protein